MRSLLLIAIATSSALITADLSFDDNDDRTSEYAEVRVLLDQYYVMIARKHNSYNDYNAKRVSESLRKSAFDDGTEASNNRRKGVAGELFENDIILTLTQARNLIKEADHRSTRQLQLGEQFVWPNITIPYQFASNDLSWQEIVRQGLNLVENDTCLRFEEGAEGRDHLRFIRGDGCWSYVGRAWRNQPISIGYGCEQPGIVAHETLHALGLWHEQSRPDRDDHITINYDNIFRDVVANFEKRGASTVTDLEQPYDLGSVMHYGPTAFAKDFSVNTVITRDKVYQHTIGQRNEVSFKDAKTINMRYCSTICDDELPCENGGYTDPNACSQCKCPPGYGGILCENVEESNRPFCGGELVATVAYGTIESPPLTPGVRCVWRIKSPHRVEVAFDSMDFICLPTCESYVELKYTSESTSSGPRLCCSPPETPVISDGDDFVVIFNTAIRSDPRYRGFKLRYRTYEERAPLTTESSIQNYTSNVLASSSSIDPTTPRATTSTTRGSTTGEIGRWSDWGDWSACTQSCGGCGVRRRHRTCAAHDAQCRGPAEVRESCGEAPCPTSTKHFMCRGRLVLPCELMNKLKFSSGSPYASASMDPSLPHMELGGENHRLIREHERRRRTRGVAEERDAPYCEKRFHFSCPTSAMTIKIDWRRDNDQSLDPRGECCDGYHLSKGVCKKVENAP